MTYTATFPVLGELMNMNRPPKSRGAGIARSELVKAWRNGVATHVLVEVRNKRWPKTMRPSTVRITLGVPNLIRRDPHNYEITTKHIVDGLVQAGLWPDDTPDWVEVLGTRLDPGLNGRFKIEITAREEQP